MDQVLAADKASPDVAPPADAVSTSCLNCRTPVAGRFCASCGQRHVPPYPTLRELFVDAFSELSGWDGRFAVTIRALVRRPGMLTREFLEGRRAQYISPLRLYIVASLAYFLVAAAAPELRPRSGTNVSVPGGFNVDMTPRSRTQASRPAEVANAVTRARESEDALTPAEKAELLGEVERAPAVLRPFLRRAIEDPNGLQRGMLEALPRTFFILLPLFAAIVALFYRGRRYPEHLYFAIHLHALVFLVLTIPELLSFTRSPALADTVGIAVSLWILVYATLALRRVYGGSLGRTLAKEVGIAAIYGMTSVLAFTLTMYWVSIAA